MPFEIIRDDITHSTLEALVCPSGSDMVPEGGVSAAIFTAAGSRLMRECRKVGVCPRGGAVLTRGHDLKTKYIIHTVGPQWKGGSSGEEQLLRSCYRSCLTLAKNSGIASVAFPLIASGTYGYPKAQAIRIATEEIGAFLLENEDMLVQLVIYDLEAFKAGSRMFETISSYVDEHYIAAHTAPSNSQRHALRQAMSEAGITETPLLMDAPVVMYPTIPGQKGSICPKCQQPIRRDARFCGQCGARLEDTTVFETADKAPAPSVEAATMRYTASSKKAPQKLWPALSAAAPSPDTTPGAKKTLESRLSHLSDPFSTYLLHLIDLSGKTDAEIYKKANIDRKLFSKIRSNPHYQPKKTTALALAVALELSLDDTADLLQRAGYALSPANKFDLIISYFIENGNYNIFEINEALFCFEQQLLGA